MKQTNKDKLKALETNLAVMNRKFESYEAKFTALEEQRKALRHEKGECADLVRELEEERVRLTKAVTRNEYSQTYSRVQKLCKKYDIEYDVDIVNSDYDFNLGVPINSRTYWVSQPDWLEGDDPLVDGHYARDMRGVWSLVDFYAKHHPDHPDHANREYNEGYEGER